MSLNKLKFLWLAVIISYICFANARQIRYSRYNTDVIEDREDSNQNGVQATVREIKLAPYPASGLRPSKAFPLPNETSLATDDSTNKPETDEIPATTPETLALITTTPIVESDAEINSQNDSAYVDAGETAKAPYPAAGFQPRIPFLLPTANFEENIKENSTDLAITEIPEENTTVLPLETATNKRFPLRLPAIAAGKDLLNILFKNQQENDTELSITEVPEENTTDLPMYNVAKAPYPAAGYRPSKAFLLPTEQLKLAETEDESKQDSSSTVDNSKHPVCGSSTNPLAPKPLDGEKEDPNSESIFLNGQIQRNQQILNIPVRLAEQPIQPLLLTRPFVYTAHIQTW